jgi:hypothetical protein
MTDTTSFDFSGEWKTDKGKKVVIEGSLEIPAQKVWRGLTEDGKEVYFTQQGKPLFFTEVGELIEKKRGEEKDW